MSEHNLLVGIISPRLFGSSMEIEYHMFLSGIVAVIKKRLLCYQMYALLIDIQYRSYKVYKIHQMS